MLEPGKKAAGPDQTKKDSFKSERQLLASHSVGKVNLEFFLSSLNTPGSNRTGRPGPTFDASNGAN